MNCLSFSIHFEKFASSALDVEFTSGLHVVYGNSGTGKSAFIHTLLGETNEKGFQNYSLSNIKIPNSVSVVFQNPNHQIISPSLGGELAFSLENQSKDPNWIQKKVERMSKALPFDADLNRNPIYLSGGEKEILNIITGMSTNPKCLILDDSLSFLSDDAKKDMVSQLKTFAQENESTILWFSSEIKDLNYTESKWEITLSEFKQCQAKIERHEIRKEFPKGAMDIKCNNLHFSYDDRTVFTNLNIEKTSFRSLGISGENGSGKTTIANLIQKIISADEGTFSISQKGVNVEKLAYIDQFPENLLMGRTLSFLFEELIAHKFFNPHLERTFKKRLERFQIQWEAIAHKNAMDLSWASLRISLIVLLTHCEYNLLILDEPSFGLGWEQKRALTQYLMEIMKKKHFIIISHDQSFLRQNCDQVWHLEQSTLTKVNYQYESEKN